MAEPRFVDVIVEANPGVEECALRWKMEDAPRPIRAVRWLRDDDSAVICDVHGWSSAGGGSPVPAEGCSIEDSSDGVAVLVWGGDWGVRLVPRDGGATLAESHLRLSPEDIVA